MGYRYRKSFKLGPFRINLSKSGVGWSVGNKYARYTRKANGGTRVTTTLPGTGISHVEELSRSQGSAQWVREKPLPPKEPDYLIAGQSKRRIALAAVAVALLLGALLLGILYGGDLGRVDYSDNWQDAPSRQVVTSPSDG